MSHLATPPLFLVILLVKVLIVGVVLHARRAAHSRGGACLGAPRPRGSVLAAQAAAAAAQRQLLLAEVVFVLLLTLKKRVNDAHDCHDPVLCQGDILVS